MTTVGIGGPARALCPARSPTSSSEALAWAAERDLPVRPVGLGSNLLAADEGVDALVVRLEGDLAAADVARRRARRRRRRGERGLPPPRTAAGLGGFEFACAIPGTAGGGVRMNAGRTAATGRRS